jgi:hypothetical protein
MTKPVILNLVPHSSFVPYLGVGLHTLAIDRVGSLVRRVVSEHERISKGIFCRLDEVLNDPKYIILTPPLPEISGPYAIEVGISCPQSDRRDYDQVNIQVCFSLKDLQSNKQISPALRKALTSDDGFKFALYNRETGLISRSKGFEVTADKIAAYVMIDLGECNNKPDRNTEVALKHYLPQERFILIPFLNGIPIIPE